MCQILLSAVEDQNNVQNAGIGVRFAILYRPVRMTSEKVTGCEGRDEVSYLES